MKHDNPCGPCGCGAPVLTQKPGKKKTAKLPKSQKKIKEKVSKIWRERDVDYFLP